MSATKQLQQDTGSWLQRRQLMMAHGPEAALMLRLCALMAAATQAAQSCSVI
jgi:hypothetical protein